MLNEKWLNLACGNNKIEHRNPVTQQADGYYFGIDIINTEAADAVMDLESFPWDIESESVEDIICSHYVEHTPMETIGKRLLRLVAECSTYDQLRDRVFEIDPNAPSDGLILFMDETYRILKPGAKMKIIAPYYSSVRAVQDPTHRRYISEATFFYFNKGWRELQRLDHYGIKCDFDFEYGYDIAQLWTTRAEDARNYAIIHYNNSINDIHVTLTKRKIE